MSLVLAIEPDHRQGAVLKRIVREHVHAELLLVDSPDAAIATFSTQLPDVILLSAFLAPADEDDLLEKLRSLDGGSHIQTYTIPQFLATKADEEAVESGGFFGRFRKNKKKGAAPITGCDPDAFAQEIVTFVARAHELRSQSEGAAARALRLALRDGSSDMSASTDNVVEPTTSDTDGSSWASPFEWRRTDPSRTTPSKPIQRAPSIEPAPALPADEGIEALRRSVLDEVERTDHADHERAQTEEIAAKEAEAAAERQRQDERQRQEEEQRRLEAEAAAQREREEEDRLRREAEARAEEEERKRLAAAEAAAKKKREEEERRRVEAEAKKRHEEEERKRLAAEAAAKKQREEEERRRLEAEAKKRHEEEERKRLAAEAAAKKQREEEERRRLEAEAKKRREEEERKRLAAEAAAKKQREEEEHKRLAAEAAAKKQREEEERRRVEAEAATQRQREEEERQRLELEAKKREEEEERQRLDAEAAAEKQRDDERARVEAEAAAAQEQEERERQERLAAAEATARKRREEKARKLADARNARAKQAPAVASPAQPVPSQMPVEEAPQAPASSDAFAEFREEHDGPRGVLRLMPLGSWARTETTRKPAVETAAQPGNDLQDLIEGLSVPPQVAVITYPTGCRIRRVRVRAVRTPAREGGRKPLIVSRRALEASRTAGESHTDGL